MKSKVRAYYVGRRMHGVIPMHSILSMRPGATLTWVTDSMLDQIKIINTPYMEECNV